MKFAVISDTHFGYAYHTERKDDSFVQGAEAIEKALENGVDAILLAGDIFDSRVPSQDVLGRVMQIFLKCATSENRGVVLDSTIDKSEGEISRLAFKGTPVIAIHGTHERRGKGLMNPLQVLERAGLLVHLHLGTVVLKKGEEKVAIHGMSGVPEKYAKAVFEQWAPKSIEGIPNLLMLHQSISKYLYSSEDVPTLDVHDFPEGFNLIIDGHIHWKIYEEHNGKKFLIPGSTVRTQLRKIESETLKGFFIYEPGKEPEFVQISTPRNFHYKVLEFEGLQPNELAAKIRETLAAVETNAKKPLVRLKLDGTLKEGFSRTDIGFDTLEKEFGEKFVLKLDYSKIETKELIEQRELVERLREKQLSVDEMGFEILKKHLKEMDYTAIEESEPLLNSLSSGDVDSVYNLLKEKKHGKA